MEYRIVNRDGEILAVCYSERDAQETKTLIESHLKETLHIDRAKPIE